MLVSMNKASWILKEGNLLCSKCQLLMQEVLAQNKNQFFPWLIFKELDYLICFWNSLCFFLINACWHECDKTLKRCKTAISGTVVSLNDTTIHKLWDTKPVLLLLHLYVSGFLQNVGLNLNAFTEKERVQGGRKRIYIPFTATSSLVWTMATSNICQFTKSYFQCSEHTTWCWTLIFRTFLCSEWDLFCLKSLWR